jgi:thiamine-phosphate pyrophosphorylase
VTDAAAVRRCLIQQARHGIAAGIELIQIRERDLQAADLAALVSEIVGLARGSRTRVLVNDRVDVAIASGADGVHLRADSVPSAEVRALAPRGFVIGRSVHAVDEAVAAASSVDYLVAGTVWRSRSKAGDHAVLGTAGLARIAAAVAVPVLAIGGVTVQRLPDVARAGAAGIAAIGLFMAELTDRSADCRAGSLEAVVTAARAAFDTPGSAS